MRKDILLLAAAALPFLANADYYSPGGNNQSYTQPSTTPQYQPQQQYQAPTYQTQQPAPAPTYTAPAQSVPQYQNPAPTYTSPYPTYPGGVYLPPGPTFPGEDAANRIYEENKHPPR